MAQKVNIVLVDDLDGGPADETVTFALDGRSYEIDLSDTHAVALRDALSGYIGHARKVGSSSRRSRSTSSSTAAGDIREWARSNGYEVSERGRISAEIREAYASAH